ncbi:ribonuclease P protein component [Cryobacterium sp. RTS3]|uniref:ribonuclease P protein component n=1 Tax=Cryobacterium sp. RTS3 TaxID=3048643 RepID=UPI002B227EEF|nr:ribonuclease P protein component [Cryobacterium sp. RTS3]MEB0000651.1 ribonuclease P protein component [Cryobacterium sp. RTS3]
MLAGTNRITSGNDYKMVVRRGVRVVGPHFVTYLRDNAEGLPPRFGFIVAKNVGNAVRRNRMRRRLKAACFGLLPTVNPGTDVVIRALPAAHEVEWPVLQAEVSQALLSFQRRHAAGTTGSGHRRPERLPSR